MTSVSMLFPRAVAKVFLRAHIWVVNMTFVAKLLLRVKRTGRHMPSVAMLFPRASLGRHNDHALRESRLFVHSHVEHIFFLNKRFWLAG